MPFAHLRDLLHTLRWRLTLWTLAVVLVLVLASLTGVRAGLRQALLHEFDQLLLEDAKEIDINARQLPPRSRQLQTFLDRKAQGHAQHGWFAQLFDQAGQPVFSTVNTPEEEVPTVPGVADEFVNYSSYRLLHKHLVQPGRAALTLRIGASLQPLEEDIALLTRTTLLAGLVIVVLTPLASYWLAGRATEPLARIIHTTGGLQPDNLADRLPLRGTGDELDQLSGTINGLLDRIAAFVRRKREILADAAHELRSPLAAIQSSVELALSSERSSAEYQERLSEIAEVCESLRGLVNQLLLIETRPTPTGRARLDQIVARSLNMFEGAAEHAHVQLRADRLEEAIVPGEETYLRPVVNNLVDNAIKFNRPGGNVIVELLTDVPARKAVLRVADTGAGIASEDLPHVFERFYRGDKSRPREVRGHGLGLSICQSIVEAYGGTIVGQSTPGQGSTFTVTLPLAPVAS